MLKRFLSLISIIFLWELSFADWERISSPKFKIYYHPRDAKNAHKVLEALERAYPSLTSVIGYDLRGPVDIYLCGSQREFDRLTGWGLPRWSEGVARPKLGLIFLKSPRFSRAHLQKAAVHELCHVLLGRATKGHYIPRWFDEGLAVYLSGQAGFGSGLLIARALRGNSIIWLSAIDSVLTFEEDKARLAYLESASTISYILEKFGQETLVSIIHELKKGKDMNQALKDVLGLDLYDFEVDWYFYLKDKYKWNFLIDIDFYFWIILPLLVVFAIIAIRVRNRRILKKWEEEERFEDFEGQ